jgi:hypothetical protein
MCRGSKKKIKGREKVEIRRSKGKKAKIKA